MFTSDTITLDKQITLSITKLTEKEHSPGMDKLFVESFEEDEELEAFLANLQNSSSSKS